MGKGWSRVVLMRRQALHEVECCCCVGCVPLTASLLEAHILWRNNFAFLLQSHNWYKTAVHFFLFQLVNTSHTNTDRTKVKGFPSTEPPALTPWHCGSGRNGWFFTDHSWKSISLLNTLDFSVICVTSNLFSIWCIYTDWPIIHTVS